MKELQAIQIKLKAPKTNRNQFGGFNYRKASDILESVKDLLKECKCSITLTDSIELVGSRYFLKATATLTNEGGETATATAFAELDGHKGMSAEQATGAASSYARKYALCGLLAIDDSSVDPDTLQPTDKVKEVQVFMDNNAKSVSFYLDKYNHAERGEFTDTELVEIYNQLRRNGKL